MEYPGYPEDCNPQDCSDTVSYPGCLCINGHEPSGCWKGTCAYYQERNAGRLPGEHEVYDKCGIADCDIVDESNPEYKCYYKEEVGLVICSALVILFWRIAYGVSDKVP